MAKKKTSKESRAIKLDAVPMDDLFDDKSVYLARQQECQIRLMAVQQAYYRQGLRAMLVFEGWDCAGKGGAIRRVTERLDPRGFRVWPIAEPLPEEQGRHYLYRFWTKLPLPGTTAIFDRSWYGRVLVERVEALTAKSAWRRAYGEINRFEEMLVDDGIRLVKIFLHITPEEQLDRFRARIGNPLKRWKMAPSDIRSRARHDDYLRAYEDMFARTNTDIAPWHVIGGDQKWSARVRVLETLIEALSRDVDIEPPPLDPVILDTAEKLLDGDDVAQLTRAIDRVNNRESS
jgi:polyphosphate kinase 2 (PPK2 family)